MINPMMLRMIPTCASLRLGDFKANEPVMIPIMGKGNWQIQQKQKTLNMPQIREITARMPRVSWLGGGV